MAGENLKKVLSSADGLEITFFVDGGVARIEFRSDGSAYHLDNPEDIIVFVDGRSIPVASAGVDAATAGLGDWDAYDKRPTSIMIRVDEFFEGWELD